MSVKIRLSRIGKKQEPFFRLVAIDSRKKRDGACLQDLGTYNAVQGTIVTFDEESYNSWISKGAQPSDSALKIYRQFKKFGLNVKPVSTKTTKKSSAQAVEVQQA